MERVRLNRKVKRKRGRPAKGFIYSPKQRASTLATEGEHNSATITRAPRADLLIPADQIFIDYISLLAELDEYRQQRLSDLAEYLLQR
jgi:hypothetical protein